MTKSTKKPALVAIACENSRPSLLARVAFPTRAGSEEGRLFSQAIVATTIGNPI